MFVVYEVSSPNDPAVYIGFSRNTAQRLSTHKRVAKRENTPLAVAMTRHGPHTYSLKALSFHETEDEAKEEEGKRIRNARAQGVALHNVSDGKLRDWRSALTPKERAEIAKLDVVVRENEKLYHDAVAIREAIRKRATRRMRWHDKKGVA